MENTINRILQEQIFLHCTIITVAKNTIQNVMKQFKVLNSWEFLPSSSTDVKLFDRIKAGREQSGWEKE